MVIYPIGSRSGSGGSRSMARPCRPVARRADAHGSPRAMPRRGAYRPHEPRHDHCCERGLTPLHARAITLTGEARLSGEQPHGRTRELRSTRAIRSGASLQVDGENRSGRLNAGVRGVSTRSSRDELTRMTLSRDEWCAICDVLNGTWLLDHNWAVLLGGDARQPRDGRQVGHRPQGAWRAHAQAVAGWPRLLWSTWSSGSGYLRQPQPNYERRAVA